MTKTDVAKILTLLQTLYPSAPQLKGDMKTIVEAWYLILGPYEYDDVKLRAVAWNAGEKGKYCPDARELIPAVRATRYTVEDLRQAWRQDCWAWAHTGIVPDDWQPSEFLLAEMAQLAPGTA